MLNNDHMTIYLVRHASYDNSRGIMPGRLPVPLSEQGIKEADKLKQFFTDKNISTIYSSQVLRCQQTSEIISNDVIPMIYDPRLLELFSAYQGYWEEDWSLFLGTYKDLGSESHQQVQDRLISFYQELIRKLKPNENVIICSHGDPLFFLYQHLDNQPLLPQIEAGDPTPTPADYQPWASIRPIEIKNGKPLIKTLISQKDL